MRPVEYDRLAQIEATMWWFRALHDLVLDQLERAELPESFRLLDAGCGTGGLLHRIKARFPTARSVGLDREIIAGTYARDKTGTQVVGGSIDRMPFPDRTFDVIVSLDVLCHDGVPVDASILEMRRCLRPGGVLLLNLPAYQWMLSGHDRAVSNVRRFTRPELQRSLTRAGLKPEAVRYWNGLLFPLIAVHRLLLDRSEHSDVRGYPEWQERLFGFVLRLEALIRDLGFNLPFGVSVWSRGRRPEDA